MNLVIVESPTKAKTISKFLKKDFKVESSYGHIRDLPKGKMGIDIENNFAPQYVIPTRCRKRVNELKKLAAGSDLIYFATDEDREGEAISWHLVQIIQPEPEKIKRIAFHEITKEAVLESLKNPRQIDLNMVDAQQARRILDRLVGYELSPFLWRKVAKGLSAGRVQSVTVRFIVEREKEIKNFQAEKYWTIEGIFTTPTTPPYKGGEQEGVVAELQKIDHEKIKQTVKHQLFAGDYSTTKTSIISENQAQKIIENLQGAEFKVASVDKKETKKNPPAPFTTSTLQQEAARKLGFSSKQTMILAQQLYEGIKLGKEGNAGLITYMRTDSVNLADKFIGEAADFISAAYGKNYLETKRYKTKSKMAQEAHEAIRPTEAARTPESVQEYLDPRQFKLYNLIWRRAVATQMSPAVLDSTSVNISGKNCLFQTSGSVVRFDGFMKVYAGKNEEKILPELKTGEILNLEKLNSEEHFTSPPPRYSEASLIKTLEQFGIGRPSTYAPIMSTVQDRGYVEKDESKRFIPKEIGVLVNDLLAAHFPAVVDISFTAKMENDLDGIAQGEKEWVPIVREFYEPFKKNLDQKEKELSKKDIAEEETDIVCEKCGHPMIIKFGRYGKFLACSGFPDCKNTKPLKTEGGAKGPEPETTEEKCEKCGADMVVKHGRYGAFLGCSKYPDCKNIKSLAKSTGVKCPQCQEGEIVGKRSKRGKTFYACNRWPKCEFALWQKPTGEKCPDCGSLLTFAAGGKIKCSNKECKFSKKAEEKS